MKVTREPPTPIEDDFVIRLTAAEAEILRDMITFVIGRQRWEQYPEKREFLESLRTQINRAGCAIGDPKKWNHGK